MTKEQTVIVYIKALITLLGLAAWYGFDDTLAEIVNCPALGNIEYWSIVALYFFIAGFTRSFRREAYEVS